MATAKILAHERYAILVEGESHSELMCQTFAGGSIIHDTKCTAYQERAGRPTQTERRRFCPDAASAGLKAQAGPG
jgi:hypothetical protein